jgi:DNA mismatch endonuclease (patch repair protein)
MKSGFPMSRVRSEGTRPERRVQAALRELGLEFRTNAADLPGTPDIVLDELKTVIMVHGCFWHVHQECARRRRLPNKLWSRQGYWAEKLARNALRDSRVEDQLQADGWRVAVLWECEVGTIKEARRAVATKAQLTAYHRATTIIRNQHAE